MDGTCYSKSEHKSNYQLRITSFGENGVLIVISQTGASVKIWISLMMILTLAGFYYLGKNIVSLQVGLGFILLTVFWKVYGMVNEESLLVLKSLGIQVKTRYFLGRTSTKFIDISAIKDVVINEAVSMHQVVCYLSVLLSETESQQNGLFPLFMGAQPSLSTLKNIYQVVQPMISTENSSLENK